MERRAFLVSTLGAGAGAVGGLPAAPAAARDRAAAGGAADRRYMVETLEKMAGPVLSLLARGRLRSGWTPELSPAWNGWNPSVAYLEAFGRLVSGIAPWLALPDDAGPEGRLRAALRDKTLASYAHSVDPASPDYMAWRSESSQSLVDSAYFTNAFMRAPGLWKALDTTTRGRIVAEVKQLRRFTTPWSNWLCFAAMNEAFLLWAGEEWDPVRLDWAVKKINEWYVGDGWYSDGPRFHFDHYGSYVIHPMLVEILEVAAASGFKFNSLDAPALLDQAYRRMQRFGEHLERMVAPDGSYLPVGRSLTYRTAVFQPLGLLAWRKRLPATLPEGQVRAATVAAQRAIFRFASNFDADGFLTLGFAGRQPKLADWYSNAGSMYIASESLVALGLPASDSYWTARPLPWTSVKAFSGEEFPKDGYVAY